MIISRQSGIIYCQSLIYQIAMQQLRLKQQEKHICLSNLQILSRLGKGSSAHVFQAQSTKHKSNYAMKVIDKKSATYSSTTFVKQLSFHQQLKHRHIVQYIKHFEDQDNQYVITEFCEGGELTKLTLENISEEMLAFIAIQISKGLYYLHQIAQVSHCDLKLSNILIKNFCLKICDFGYSQNLQQTNQSTQISGQKICGTLYYLSPEILINNKKQFYKEADVWALGICLLTLLAKKAPYEGDSYRSIKKQIINGNFLRVQCSIELTDLFSALLNLDPQKRIKISQIFDHPFFQKYNMNEIYSKIFGQIEVDSKEMNELKAKYDFEIKKTLKTKKSKKLFSSDQKYQQNSNELFQNDQSAKKWFFRDTSKSNLTSEDETIDNKRFKRVIGQNDHDNNQTVKKSKQTPIQNQEKITSLEEIKPMRAQLIHPFEEFIFETKNNGYIKIKSNADLEIKVKKTIFEIQNQKSCLKLNNKCYFYDQMIKKANKTQLREVIELYQYAYNAIEIFKQKKFKTYEFVETFNYSFTIALSKDQRHVSGYFVSKYLNSPVLLSHKPNHSKLKVVYASKIETTINLKTFFDENKPKLDQKDSQLKDFIISFLNKQIQILQK